MSLLSTCKRLIFAGSLAMFTQISWAQAAERGYFRSVEGTWSGSGKIVAGPYKNTKFTCNFKGAAPQTVGMKLTGKCRVGLFTQPMSAIITKSGASYRGQFLDGAKGKGLDIVSGSLRGSRLVVSIKRKKLTGTMVAKLQSNNKLDITIAVRVNQRLIPFIGLSLNRTGGPKRAAVGQ